MSSPLITAVRQVLQPTGEKSLSVVDQVELTEKPGGPGSMESERLSEARRKLVVKDTSVMTKPQLITEGSVAVSEMMQALKADKKIVTCQDIDEMALALSKDESTSVEAAKAKLLQNQARAFTAETDGVIYFLECPERPHDEIHETVHVTSAPGGTTKIKTEFGDPLNEGFTEMYTKDICLKLKVKIAPAYPNEVAFMLKLQRAVGHGLLFDAYMKNAGMDKIISALADRWAQRSEGFGSDEATRDFVAPGDAQQWAVALADRLKNGNFIGTAAPFWSALLQ